MTAAQWSLRIVAAASDELEIVVYDRIGDKWSDDGVTAKRVLDQLRAAPKAKKISLRINSVGGSVAEGVTIMSLLRARANDGAEIRAHVDGVAASAAAYLTVVASHVSIASNGFFMLHEASGFAAGRARDFESQVKMLKQINATMAGDFAAASQRRGKLKTAQDYLDEIAKGDVYLTATDAVAWGLADSVTEAAKAAAELVDVATLDGAPEELRTAPYVRGKHAPAPVPVAAADKRLERARSNYREIIAEYDRRRARLDASEPPVKQYGDMSPLERHALKASDPAAFKAARAAYLRGELIIPETARYAELSLGERHALKRQDPARFARMRAAHYHGSGA